MLIDPGRRHPGGTASSAGTDGRASFEGRPSCRPGRT